MKQSKTKVANEFPILDRVVSGGLFPWSGKIEFNYEQNFEQELKLLAPIFVAPKPHFRPIYREVFELAYFIHHFSVNLSKRKLNQQLSFNTLTNLRIHHSPEITPFIAGQFPLFSKIEKSDWGNYYKPDLIINNDLWVEVGECKVSKILDVLRGYEEVIVIPEPCIYAYHFSKSKNWKLVLQWRQWQWNIIAEDIRGM